MSNEAVVTTAPETFKARLREIAFFMLAALAINLAGNGRVSLWDRDEPRYATCTREMRQSGDLINPTFNGEPRYHKPVLIYWLMLIGTGIGGDNTFGARLISGLAGVGTVLAVRALGRRMFDAKTGRIAALIALTAPLLIVESKLATIDATLTLALVLCQFALWELSRRDSRAWAVVFWVGMAAATLLKGPIGPALMLLAALMNWWWAGPTSYWKRLQWRWGIPVFLMLTAPWYIAIGVISHGEFFRQAIGFHVITRATHSLEQHGGFPGYYPILTLVTFHPWSALIPVAVYAGWKRRKQNPAFGFLLGWIVGPLILLELARTKLIHYYVPSLPACALLISWLVLEVEASAVNLRRWPLGRLAVGLITSVGIGLTVFMLALVLLIPWSLRWPTLVIALTIAAGTLVAIERLFSGRTVRGVYVLAGTWAAAMFITGSWLLPAAEPFRISKTVARELGKVAVKEHAEPMLATFQQPSVVYELGRRAEMMTTKDRLAERVRKDGRIVTALMAHEIKILQKDPRWTLEPKDVIRGFNLDKGREEVLHVMLLKPAAPSATALRVEEKTVVK
jgi:4-amino-4-deoxy-L-arabinose transferase-like glycosyltransferase